MQKEGQFTGMTEKRRKMRYVVKASTKLILLGAQLGKTKKIRLPLGTEYNNIMIIIIYYYHIYNIYAQHVKLVSHGYALRITDTQFLSRKEVLIPPQTSPAEGV